MHTPRRRFLLASCPAGNVGVAIILYITDAFRNLVLRARAEPFIFLAAGATIIYAVFAYRQLEAMRGQLGEMTSQRLTTIAQVRANLRRESPSIIAIDYFGNPPESGDKLVGWKVIQHWKNVGSTDAQNFRGWYEVKAFDVRRKYPIGISYCPTQPIDTLPQGEISIVPGDIASKPYIIFYADDVRRGRKFILMWWHIDYTDIFPQTPPHKHDWCMVVIHDDVYYSKFTFNVLRDKGD
jgi:hypothetical protein